MQFDPWYEGKGVFQGVEKPASFKLFKTSASYNCLNVSGSLAKINTTSPNGVVTTL